MPKTTDAVEILDSLIANDPCKDARIAEARIRSGVAMQVYKLREGAGLTPEKLAGLVGCPLSVIDDLEMSDYKGDAVAMLATISRTLGVKSDHELMECSVSKVV